MVIFNKEEVCNHNISFNERSGTNVVNIRPLFSHDSQHIIIACGSCIKVFAVKSGECIQTLRHHFRPIVSIRQSKKNDLQVLSCSDDGIVVRWDYIDGHMLEVHDLQMSVASFYVPTPTGPWFITKQFEDHYRLYSILLKTNGSKPMQVIFKCVQPHQNSLDFGCMGVYCASIFGNVLTIYKFDQISIRRHITGDRNLTCVACHPSDFVLATGDDHGRVVLWSNALSSNQPIRSIYHWHTLPVADLAFSSQGSHLHSGGGEAALVKWNLFSEERFILPRMGAPILHITTSRDNRYVLTAHQDNVLQVVDAQRNIVQVIQGLTRSQPQKNALLLPTGLLYDVHLRALIMNGKPGHLQFYDILQDKQLFNLDIASKNLISQERESDVFNIDVQKSAVDDSGLWLATAEYWSNGDTSPQIWLKFWMYDLEKQTFVLNTNVILPHNKELNTILFRPHSPSSLAATTSSDGKFKIWYLDTSPDGKHSWSCEAMGCYRDLPAGTACFSEEGSLLGVAFGSVATLWNVEGTALKAVLCSDRNKKDIRQLVFGHHSCCQFLICHNGSSITVWNVLTLSISWIVHNEVQVMVADPFSCTLAAFCKDQHLILFTPDNPKPIRTFMGVSETPVLSAIFVPKPLMEKRKTGCFHDISHLFFINEAQNLLTLSESETNEVPALKRSCLPYFAETPFGMLQAAQKVTHVKQLDREPLSLPKLRDEKDVAISNPLLQNPLSLCSQILSSLLIPVTRPESNGCSSATSSSTVQHSVPSSQLQEEISMTPFKLNSCQLKFSDWSFLQKKYLID